MDNNIYEGLTKEQKSSFDKLFESKVITVEQLLKTKIYKLRLFSRRKENLKAVNKV